MYSYGPIKAILRTHQGYTREVAVYPPPPEVIQMAVSDTGTQIWNPNDLMVGEKAIFKTVNFKKTQELKGQNAWLYVQEGDPKVIAAKMDDLYKAIQPKLLEKIQDQITQAGPFFNAIKAKTSQESLAGTLSHGWTTVTEQEILDICEKHKKAYAYDATTEAQMASRGYQTPPQTGESPYDYLTRLLGIVKADQLEHQAKFQQSLEQYKALKKEYEQQQQLKQQYYDGFQAATQTNMVPQQSPLIGAQMQPLLGDSISEWKAKQPKQPEIKRPQLPDPIEPRKRLMKKS